MTIRQRSRKGLPQKAWRLCSACLLCLLFLFFHMSACQLFTGDIMLNEMLCCQ